jgi:hypothetical protein
MVVAAIGAGAGLIGAAGSLFGGSKAAGGSAQSQYLQALEMNQNIANTSPFIGAGQFAANRLQNDLQAGGFGTPMDMSGQPTAADVPLYTGGPPPQYTGGPPPQYAGGAPPQFKWDPTMAGLAQTPGYQFTLHQGLQATQNAAAARGLGVSGAALKGADTFATGLASQTYNQQLNNAESIYGNQLSGFNAGLNQYNAQLAGFGAGLNQYNAQLAGFGQGINAYNAQLAGFGAQSGAFQNQFNDYWGNQTNRYNQLYQLATLGSNAATGQGTTGTQAASNIGNAAQAGAQYQGAAIQNAGNALTGALNSPGVQNLLTGSGSNANNQSVTGGGVFNSFSGLGPYTGGYGSYYQPPNPIDPANYAQGAQTGGLL